MEDKYRRTGRTTQQLKSAPEKATFVWCNDEVRYPKEILRKIGRADIKIVPFHAFTDDRLRGLSPDLLIFDHEAIRRMNHDQWIKYRVLTRM